MYMRVFIPSVGDIVKSFCVFPFICNGSANPVKACCIGFKGSKLSSNSTNDTKSLPGHNLLSRGIVTEKDCQPTIYKL